MKPKANKENGCQKATADFHLSSKSWCSFQALSPLIEVRQTSDHGTLPLESPPKPQKAIIKHINYIPRSPVNHCKLKTLCQSPKETRQQKMDDPLTYYSPGT